MRDYFDSSTFVAAISEDDRQHEVSLEAWLAAEERFLYAHGLLETYSTLTGGRHPAHLAPDDAAAVIGMNIDEVTVLQLEPREIVRLLNEVRRHGVRGGAVYDYMHLCVARKAGVERIFTLNKRHFTAIAPDLAPKIFHPAELH